MKKYKIYTIIITLLAIYIAIFCYYGGYVTTLCTVFSIILYFVSLMTVNIIRDMKKYEEEMLNQDEHEGV